MAALCRAGVKVFVLIALMLGAAAAGQSDSEGGATSTVGAKQRTAKKRKKKHKAKPKVMVPAFAPPMLHTKEGDEKKPEPQERQPGEALESVSDGGTEGAPPPEGEVQGEEGGAAEESSSVDYDVLGYIRSRYTYAFLNPHAPLQYVTANVPENLIILEPNIQPKVRLFDSHLTLAADLSLLGESSSPYVELLANELYVQAGFLDSIYVLVGRRRVVWGTGLSWNPTDLINPPRDLIDPALTRSGSLMLPMVDVALSQVTFSAYVTAPVTYNQNGLPTNVGIKTPFVGTRVFTNQFSTDMSVMYFYDSAKQTHSLGTAASSIFLGNWEAHAEGVLHFGSVDRPALPDVGVCGPPVADTPKFGGAAVAGVRRDGSDQSLVSGEVLYSSGGYTPDEYALLTTELRCLRAAAHVQQLQDPSLAPPVSQKVVLLRQWYVSILGQHPHLADDGVLEHLGVAGGAILSIADGSVIAQARVYATFNAFTFTVIGVGFFGFGGGELALGPTKGLISFDVQWSY